jgi:hypothetical protein
MPPPNSARPVRRPWTTWAASLLILAAAVAVPFAYRHWNRPEGQPPTRYRSGRTEVFLRLPDARNGIWLPLVESTDSHLRYLTFEGVAYGSVAHVNEDGTVLLTDSATGNRRAIRELEQGLHGWPPP